MQRLGGLQRQLDGRARAGRHAVVDEVERDDVSEQGVARVVIGDGGVRQLEPFVLALGHAFGSDDLDDRCAHV